MPNMNRIFPSVDVFLIEEFTCNNTFELVWYKDASSKTDVT